MDQSDSSPKLGCYVQERDVANTKKTTVLLGPPLRLRLHGCGSKENITRKVGQAAMFERGWKNFCSKSSF
ncbi:hypothetical protein RRG08_035333 [Elysia crispata]|uniref:Uncharacterized protein n=1 Tax=Elysia crispata TaxID=231223 RepID=A0AAE1CS25_9GAST|nr:hypothetical protein RRG08_035333 [Elysia crispata]